MLNPLPMSAVGAFHWLVPLAIWLKQLIGGGEQTMLESLQELTGWAAFRALLQTVRLFVTSIATDFEEL